MYMPTSSVKNRREKELLKLFSKLGVEDQEHLMAFAEYLVNRDTKKATEKSNPPQISDPLSIARPESETVIKAIKRLTKTYPMVDKEQFLHVISDLMTAHLMQGKDSVIVIDELENLFSSAYEKLK